MGIQIILSLYLKPLRAPMPSFMATSSAQNTDVLTVNHFFENHCTNVVFTYIKKLLHDHKNTLSLA